MKRFRGCRGFGSPNDRAAGYPWGCSPLHGLRLPGGGSFFPNILVFIMDYVFFKEDGDGNIVTETVPEEDIKRVGVAASDVMRVYRVEQIFYMIMSALLEFNTQVFKQTDLKRFAADNELEYELLTIRINQCAASFLTALDMYHEYLYPDKDRPPFAISPDKFDDERFEVCKALRNYIQHISTIDLSTAETSNACACGEGLCSFSASASVAAMSQNIQKLRPGTQAVLKKYLDRKTDLNLFGVFNGVADVLFAIQQDVRNSKEYADDYERSAKFLAEMHAKLIDRGFWRYRSVGADGHPSWKRSPYFYHRQREAIDYLRRRYKVNGNPKIIRGYAIIAPQNTIDRISEADRIVERYVKQNGVVDDFGDHIVTSTEFTTEKMREWYLQGRKGT